MNRFQRSWQLFKSSLIVLGRDKRLLLFPILTTCFTVVLVLLFLMPVAFQRTGYSYGSLEHWQAVGHSIYVADNAGSAGSLPYANSPRNLIRGVRPLAVGYFVVMYFGSMFCATFFNVAFYQQILGALAGQPVSILAGLRFACSKWKSILLWTLFAGAVGYVIKALEQRFGLFGRLVMKLVGAAWSIACVFVIPVIITETETSNPLVMLKKSALTLRRTWGESLIGYVGLSFGSAITLVFSLFWLAGGIAMASALHLYWMIAAVVLSWLALIILWSYVLNVASQIFRCALFLYASQGAMPQPYTEEMAAGAWRRKH
jgi:hypothetical protein